jgi:hypothetical protein
MTIYSKNVENTKFYTAPVYDGKIHYFTIFHRLILIKVLTAQFSGPIKNVKDF